ncbi:hypothetical protein BKA67DRAFT_507382, partial [Truncatella angustata]
MNVSHPISSAIDSVDFDFLTPNEIRKISVKRIENPTTFDSLLNPTPGGLYDPALGAWGDSLCTTCNLNGSSCPGHAGHIDLPVPVYHPVFLDQVMRLLRSQCIYCNRFRMRAADLALYKCKLRLLQFGLIDEAQYLDEITPKTRDVAGVEPVEMDDDETEDAAHMTLLREKFTEHAIRRHRLSTVEIRKGKHEGAYEARRELIKAFLQDMTKGRTCQTCKGISPNYRKDQFVKIFEKVLPQKDAAKMAQGSFKRRDALTVRQQAKVAPNKKKALETDEASKKDVAPHRYVSTSEVLARLELLFEKEQEVVALLYNSRPQSKHSEPLNPGSFFLQTIMVPPNKYRPEARQGDGGIAEAQQNSLYKNILNASAKIAQIHREIAAAARAGSEFEGRNRNFSELHEACVALQNCVNSLIDKDRNPVRGAAGKRNEDGIKQKLEKKEGLFRKNMMGKRVNYAARSVISPDPNIETSEIGVPPVFAKKLTYPEPVTSHNFREMQQAVINGPDKWPGAVAIENENGQIVNLKKKSQEDRVALANQLLAPTSHNQHGMRGKKVHRHLGNGDVVLMNRQPTLHKPSIMGHRVRVLPGEKTLRMHYANCNTYNADFDGDEMNMHFPQNELARAEAMRLADTDHQYLSGTAGKPLRGLIQDHLSVSVALCNRDTFF